MSFKVLKNKRYEEIMNTALAIVINTPFDMEGVFAFDKSSGLLFEFACIADAQDVDNGHFVIFTEGNIYVNDEKIAVPGLHLRDLVTILRKNKQPVNPNLNEVEVNNVNYKEINH